MLCFYLAGDNANGFQGDKAAPKELNHDLRIDG